MSGVEDLNRLGQAADPGQERYLLPAQTIRVSRTVPVLVEVTDSLGSTVGEAHEREIFAPRSQRKRTSS